MFRRLFAGLLAGLLLLLPGCGGKENVIRMDLAGAVRSLDPQFATDETSISVVSNIFEGLLRQQPDGALVNAAAEDYTVSANGLIYTFTLRENLCWNDGTPVTADDFRFAFERILHSEVPSPYSDQYLSIKNAGRVLGGELPASALGVTAVDDRTLRFELEEPSPLFLERLAGVAAMPCNEEFFTSTRARYGLEIGYLKFNGPFTVSSWNPTSTVKLKKNGAYHNAGAVVCSEVVLHLGRGDRDQMLDQFARGNTDGIKLTYDEAQRLDLSGGVCEEFDNAVWVLTFNQNHTWFQSEPLRQALVLSLDLDGFAERFPAQYSATRSVVLPSALAYGVRYQPLPGAAPGYRPDAAKALLEEARAADPTLAEARMTLLLPRSSELSELGGYLQKMWQQNLLLYVNLEVLEDEEYQARVAAGEYDLLISAVTGAGQGPQATLSAWTTGSSRNLAGWRDESFDQSLASGLSAGSAAVALGAYQQAEERLLQSAVAVPLCSAKSYFAMGKGVSGIEYSPATGAYFPYARR